MENEIKKAIASKECSLDAAMMILNSCESKCEDCGSDEKQDKKVDGMRNFAFEMSRDIGLLKQQLRSLQV